MTRWQEQSFRVARLFVFACVTQLAAVGDEHLGRNAIIAAAIAAAESVFRQVRPVEPVKRDPDNSSGAVQ